MHQVREDKLKELGRQMRQYYHTADKYADRIESRGEMAHCEYVSLVERYSQPGQSLLDVGCGTGVSAHLLSRKGYRVTAMDVSPLFVERARSRASGNLRLCAGDALQLPFSDGSFDIVGSFLVIEHITDVEQGLAEMARVTKPGGIVVICAPNVLSPFNQLYVLRDIILARPRTYGGEERNPWKAILDLMANTAVLLRKEFSLKPNFLYRTPRLENTAEHAPDCDMVYLANPIDLKRWFVRRPGLRIVKYQGETRVGRLLPDFVTGIHIVAQKLAA
ncbi:MAG: methyltransferase domain-containing protein [Planctomycetes bacterium]|nr:methyltransferase domain-containing protein [Planctomycetota bacterium]